MGLYGLSLMISCWNLLLYIVAAWMLIMLIVNYFIQLRRFWNLWHGKSAFGQFSKTFQYKIVIIFLSNSLNMCFGCSKELSHWDGSFEYPRYMFWLRIKKIIFSYALLSGGLSITEDWVCSLTAFLTADILTYTKYERWWLW